MDDPTLMYLTFAVVVLMLGLLCTLMAKKLRFPDVLLLVITGILLNNLVYQGGPMAILSPLFLTSIGIIAMVMVVFDSASRFKFKEFDDLSLQSLKLIVVFLLLNLLILAPLTMVMAGFPFKLYFFILALIFASAMSGTDAAIVLTVFKGAKSKVTNFLEVESLLNTPVTVLMPFILLDVAIGLGIGEKINFIKHVIPFLTQFVAGIGAGVLVGILLFKVMRKYYSEQLSPLAIIVSALLTYILAEWIGGNGVLAVTALGLVFGSVYIKQKVFLMEFSSIFSSSLQIFVFVLVGFIIALPPTPDFLIKSSALFAVYVLVRFLAVHISFTTRYNLKEKLFMSFTMPKGIAVAVVVFSLAGYNLEGLANMLHFMLVFILYSILLASIAAKYSNYFIKADVVKEGPVLAVKK